MKHEEKIRPMTKTEQEVANKRDAKRLKDQEWAYEQGIAQGMRDMKREMQAQLRSFIGLDF